MKFTRLFSIDIRHDYFESSFCADLQVQPTLECSRLLKSHKLFFKNSRPGNVSVVAALNEQDKLSIKPATDIAFDFYVFLLNPDFVNYSNLPARKKGEYYIFSSKKVDEKKTFQFTNASIDTAPKIISGKPLLGLLKIFFEPTFPVAYTLHFEAAEATWKYYFLANNNIKNLSIDASLAGISFSKKASTAKEQQDKIITAINEGFPEANLVVFESNASIQYLDIGRKDIQLINADKNNVLINHLPNPSFHDNGIKIINLIN